MKDVESLKKWCKSNIERKIGGGIFETNWQQSLKDVISVYCFMPMNRKIENLEEYKNEGFKSQFQTLKAAGDLAIEELKKIKSLNDDEGSKRLMFWCLGTYTKGFIKKTEELYKAAEKYCKKTQAAAK